MINKKLFTKNKKIFVLSEKINTKDKFYLSDKILTKNILSTCKHGTEKWIINQKAHWIQNKRDKISNYFTSKKFNNFKDGQPLGNMIIGKIISSPKNVKNIKKGDVVLAYSGAADYSILNFDNIICKVKKGVPFENYLCFDPLLFVIGALRDSKFKYGDNIGVVGLGAIGMIALNILKKNSIGKLIAVDLNVSRLKLAKKLGAEIILNSSKKNPIEKYRTKEDKIGLDVVFDFSGSVSGLNNAISLSKYNGKVIAGSMYEDANSSLKLGKEFHWNNIKIISSRAVNEPYCDYPSWNKKRLNELALKIINSKKYQFKSIINKKFLFKDAIKLYKKNIKDNKMLKLTFIHK